MVFESSNDKADSETASDDETCTYSNFHSRV